MDKKKKENLREVLNTSERFSSVVIVDPYNQLLATPMNECSKEAAILLYGNCEVLHDNTVDRHRAIRIILPRKGRCSYD